METRLLRTNELRQVGAVAAPESDVWWAVSLVPLLERSRLHGSDWVIRWGAFFSPAVHDRWRLADMEAWLESAEERRPGRASDWIQATSVAAASVAKLNVSAALHEAGLQSGGLQPGRVLFPPLMAYLEYLDNWKTAVSWATSKLASARNRPTAIGALLRHCPWVLLDETVRRLACEAVGLHRVFSPLWESALAAAAGGTTPVPGKPVEVPCLSQEGSFLEMCRHIGRKHGDRRGRPLLAALPDLRRADNALRRWNSQARRRFTVPVIARIPGDHLEHHLGKHDVPPLDRANEEVDDAVERVSTDEANAILLLGAGGLSTGRFQGSVQHRVAPALIPKEHIDPPVLTLQTRARSPRTAPSPG